jgi:RNA polymerase sigma factor (sigma-70 family)
MVNSLNEDVQRSRDLDLYSEINRKGLAPPLTPQREKELFLLLKDSPEHIKKIAENEIALHNLRLVQSVINSRFKEYLSNHPDHSELESAGMLGLTRAIKDFDVDKGYKFSTYAWKAIFTTIKQSIYGRKYSLNQISFDEDYEKGYYDNSAEIKESKYRNDQELYQQLRNLPERSRKIIQARFLDYELKSLSQIGEEVELTKERVRQIQKSILKDLRHGLEGRVVF